MPGRIPTPWKWLKILTSLCACSELYAHGEHTRQEQMRKLSIYKSGTDAHPDHTHQFLARMLSIHISFPYFQMFIFNTLSIPVRNWCMHWAYTSGTDVCTKHTHQELMHALSIQVRNWCVHWAYAKWHLLGLVAISGPKKVLISLWISPLQIHMSRPI